MRKKYICCNANFIRHRDCKILLLFNMSFLENLLKNESTMRELKNTLRPVGMWLFNETQFYLIIICVYSVALLVIALATLIMLYNFYKTMKIPTVTLCVNCKTCAQ